MPIINRVAEFKDDMTAWRRHLHENPELGFEERATAAFVVSKLKEFGVDEVHEGIAGTGVVGVLRSGAANARPIGLRADMDALPIEERTGLPHASRHPGKMHACGHDGHTTMLLGAARHLAETRNFDGTVYLIFQPAEEGLGGGRVMIEEGLFERFPAERVFGLHNWPSLPLGRFGMCRGPAMAAADKFEIDVKGQGCHAAMPHLGRDPITTAAQIVTALQTVVSRQVDPLDQAVISTTTIHGGDTFNVVPDRVSLSGTVRTFKAETRDFVAGRIDEIARGVAAAMGLEAESRYQLGYPPTVNHDDEADLGAEVAAEIVGAEQVDRDPLPVMGAEDFAFMLEKRPGSYIWMGTKQGESASLLHSPSFDFNDEALPLGASYWVRLVERLLPRAG